MNPTLALMLISSATKLIDNLLLQAQIARQNGDITPEQLADVERAAVDSDARRDERVEAARQRLRDGN